MIIYTKVLITYDRERSSTCSILNIIKNYINKYKSSYVLYLFNIYVIITLEYISIPRFIYFLSPSYFVRSYRHSSKIVFLRIGIV